MHKGHPKLIECWQGIIFLFIFSCFFFFLVFGLLENKRRRKKENRKKYKKENKNYIQQGNLEINLKKHPGRVDLPVPHYSSDGQSAREMTLSVGH